MGRAELFIWLACVLVAKQLFPPWVNSASPFIDALVAEFANTSAFYYLGWYAVFRLLYESDQTTPSTGMDLVFALLITALNVLPPTSISWISTTAVGMFLLATSQEDRKFQAAAAVLFALAFNGLWGPLVFDFFAFQLLQADATLVGGLLSLTQPGMSWSKTIVGTPEGHNILIYYPCSSFHNISLGLLCWVTVTKLTRTTWVAKDALVALAVCAIVILLNGSRLYLMALSLDYFTYWHEGLGQQLFVWATMLGVLLLSLSGANRFGRAT
jgi:exosortase/archaeosortase family protein